MASLHQRISVSLALQHVGLSTDILAHMPFPPSPMLTKQSANCLYCHCRLTALVLQFKRLPKGQLELVYVYRSHGDKRDTGEAEV